MRVDWDKVRADRIEQIEIDIKKAINHKKWSKKAQLEAEKADLLKKMNKK